MPSSTGIVTASTSARCGARMISMISAPISMPGARRHMRKSMLMKFITCVTSLVNRVTSEPAENLSIFANENFCTLANTSRRTSPAKLTAAFAPKYAPPTPPAIITSAVSTIMAQINRI